MMSRIPGAKTWWAIVLLAGAAAPGAAQVVPIRTVPVATGDQFLIHPSTRLGMAGLPIALDDPLGDPFVNPATGARLRRTQLFGAPAYYRVTEGDGSGATLPVGFLASGDRWFGGASLAVQEVESGNPGGVCCWIFGEPVRDVAWDPGALENRSATNHYLYGSLGRRVSHRTAVGVSASYAKLNAVDGVDLLYARSQSIDQNGHLADFRLGVTHDFRRDASAELVLLHRRTRMTHDVRYLDIGWAGDPAVPPRIEAREVTHLDHTDVWGAHGSYVVPLAGGGWRLGTAATVNYLSHPKIPDYEIMNIPRDPGESWAYDVGLGVGRDEGPLSFGVEVVYEPIWSHTWAEADSTVVGANGQVLGAGDTTIDNEFEFSNSHVRIGLGREQRRWGFQLGLHVRSIAYELDQENLLAGTSRTLEQSWLEWTPSWGLSILFPDVEVRYAGRLTSGTGRPGLAWTGTRELAAAADLDFLIAPAGPLTLDESLTLSHQLTVSVPLDGRGRRGRRDR